MIVALLQFFIGETPVFPTKYQRHRMTFRLGTHQLPRLPRIEHGPGNGAAAGAGADHQLAVGNGILQRRHHPGMVQDIRRAGSERSGVGAGKHLRIDQHQIAQTHGFQGARRRTDVGGQAGIDHDDTNIAEHVR